MKSLNYPHSIYQASNDIRQNGQVPTGHLYSFKCKTQDFTATWEIPRACFLRTLQLLRLSRKLSCITTTEPGAKQLTPKSFLLLLPCINSKTSVKYQVCRSRKRQRQGFSWRPVHLPRDPASRPAPRRAAPTYLQSVHRTTCSIGFPEQDEKRWFAAAHLSHSTQLKDRALQTLSTLGATLFKLQVCYDIYCGPLYPSPLPPQWKGSK